MSLQVHRSTDLHALVDLLREHLEAGWPDPFDAVPLVVGSRGMARWLRHELATRLRDGVAARLAFPMLRPALDGAIRRALSPDDEGPWWEADATSPWRPAAVAWRLVPILREAAADPAFSMVTTYLRASGERDRLPTGGAGEPAVSYRELAFAGQVARVLDRLVADRADDALAWLEDPASAGDHQWLATLLQLLGAADAGSPLGRLHALRGASAPSDIVFRFFAPTLLTPGERDRLTALGRVAEVHVYAWSAWGPGGSPHPVARSLGRPLATLDLLLGQSWVPSLTAGKDTLLGRLQDAIRGGTPHRGPPADDTLVFHAAHGPLRETEILRDTLLSAFAADSSLEPRDVLVMTADLATYAPLVGAVFGERLDGVPELPVSVADLGLRHTNPVAAVLLAVLELVEDRVTAPAVAALLALAPVRARFELSTDDVVEVRGLLRKSAATWGLDAADRERAGQPRCAENTLAAGVERLALGVLLPDDAPLGTIPGSGPEEPPLAPTALEGDAVRLVGVITHVVRALDTIRARVAGSSPTLHEWRAEITGILSTFVALPPELGWQRIAVMDALDRQFEDADPVHPTRPPEILPPNPGISEDPSRASSDPLRFPDSGLGFPGHSRGPVGERRLGAGAIRRFLLGRFEIGEGGDRPITGAVTMSELQPMRGVPYRFVALLGMGDTFPRGGAPRAWDPFDHPRDGELDARTLDRGLLLEAIQCATERLHVSWAGFDTKTGDRVSAAVPVEELVDAAAALAGVERKALVREHPLQPWSADPALPSYDKAAGASAAALTAGSRRRLGLAAYVHETLPPEPAPRELPLADLADAIARPQRELLYGRLGIYLAKEEEELAEREALDPDGLRAWDWRRRAYAALEAGDDPGALGDRLAGRLKAEGNLPPGAHDRVWRSVREADWQRRLVQAAGGRTEASPLLLVEAAGVVLHGRPPGVRTRGGHALHEWVEGGRIKPGHVLKAWIFLLAARAAGQVPTITRLVGWSAGEPCEEWLHAAFPPKEAEAMLADLLEVRALARRRPVLLFGETSSTFVGAPPTDAEKLAKEVWEGAPWNGVEGERKDPWIAPFFADTPLDYENPILDGFVDLARRVWRPIEKARLERDDAWRRWQAVPE